MKPVLKLHPIARPHHAKAPPEELDRKARRPGAHVSGVRVVRPVPAHRRSKHHS